LTLSLFKIKQIKKNYSISQSAEPIEALEGEIFTIKNEADFSDLALRIFSLQYLTNKVYRKYCDHLNVKHDQIKQIEDIPFLPIQFFKTEMVKTGAFIPELAFKSSGTGGNRSTHFLKKRSLYEKSFHSAFAHFYGPAKDLAILALLPSYLEQGDSSLVYMCDQLIKQSTFSESGFFLNEQDRLIKSLRSLAERNVPTVLIGVAYALLDLSEKADIDQLRFKKLTIMETGGMKGRRKELIRDELHAILKTAFDQDQIHSEYGMTELLSQAYSKADGYFQCPPWMKVLIRKQEDPFKYADEGQIGGINIIDLANLYSCCFIQTDDLGRRTKSGFEVLGRYDSAEVRGCNLLVAD
jgi:phenylacetate-coenzyme A ligase PaaK-like adenylate-forming protein